MSRGQKPGEGDIRRGSGVVGIKAKSRAEAWACSSHLLALCSGISF